MTASFRPLAALLVTACASGSSASSNQAPVPTPRTPVVASVSRTAPAITADDLRRRLGAYAHDSMLGREAGTLGNVKATDHLAAELARLGLEPAGDEGTYFQTIPLVRHALDTTAVMSVGRQVLVLWRDYVPFPHFGGFLPFGMRGSVDGAATVYAGRLGDPPSLSAEQVAGRLVLLLPPLAPMNPMQAMAAATQQYGEAAGIVFALLDFVPPNQLDFLRQEPEPVMDAELPEGPLGALVTLRTAAALLGASPDSVSVGHVGNVVDGSFGFVVQPTAHPARNVIGIVRGSDPVLQHQYVAIGAHNDHDGIRNPVDHDSARAANAVLRPQGAESPPRRPSAAESQRIRTLLDSLRAQRPPRLDSVMNGADDDGSGTVTALEIAEALARGADRPRRSVLFVFHTAEEKGLLGAAHFTEHPTVPRDSIVAHVNMDMVGRGGAGDLEGGGPGYIQLIGSRRLSTELGDLVEAVNARGRHGFTFDYQYDADGHPQNYYCRSDHYMYARFGIPVVFFTTGSHQDYHMVTDEPQYIDYDKMGRVGRFVADLVRTLADRDQRVAVDKPKPDPYGECRQ